MSRVIANGVGEPAATANTSSAERSALIGGNDPDLDAPRPRAQAYLT